MTFASRSDAGRQLGLRLKRLGLRADRVLGLPRGGVVVAAEIARVLSLPLGVLAVRKIGHPSHREFAVGALAEPDVVVLDKGALGLSPLNHLELQLVIAEETERLKLYQARFHSPARRSLSGLAVLIADDGLATGATMEAAVRSARQQNVLRVTVAVPVASPNGVQRLKPLADDLIALWVDPDFEAVGGYYEIFNQTTDGEVFALLGN